MLLVKNRVCVIGVSRLALVVLETASWPWPLKIAAVALELYWPVTPSVRGEVLDASIIQCDSGCKKYR